jgi:hypothetical protein
MGSERDMWTSCGRAPSGSSSGGQRKGTSGRPWATVPLRAGASADRVAGGCAVANEARTILYGSLPGRYRPSTHADVIEHERRRSMPDGIVGPGCSRRSLANAMNEGRDRKPCVNTVSRGVYRRSVTQCSLGDRTRVRRLDARTYQSDRVHVTSCNSIPYSRRSHN